ncbi:MAG: hypothetical protein J6U10_03995 [Lachnospiraceae bacterium]|nr:hypothetical protein [Lachnospiraceae bacterium]
MVIQTSNVQMASYQRTSVSKYESVGYESGYGGILSGLSGNMPGIRDAGREEQAGPETPGAAKESGAEKLYELNKEDSTTGRTKIKDETISEEKEFTDTFSSDEKKEFGALESIFRTIDRDRSLRLKRMSPKDILDRILERMRIRLDMLLGNYGYGTGMGGAAVKYENMEITKYTEVEESTAFESSGTVTTADGRSIDFGVSFSRTERFTEATSVTINFKQLYLTDPLVINLGDDNVSLSDEKFVFDLDCDGEEDNISLLGKMSGFLALDANGDGVINDGSELFGAKTGDGFKELAVFDLDGNGWIDENDEIFNRLRIWKKNDDGTDTLVGLGVAGVGAIYLGNVDTKIKAVSGETLNGMVQKSGIYLREDGSAGTVQHVDLSKEKMPAASVA